MNGKALGVEMRDERIDANIDEFADFGRKRPAGAGSGNLPVLPESALQTDGKGSYVLIVNGRNMVERRDVVIGQVSSAGASVTSGLNGTEKVVTLAGGFLTVGQKVRPEIAR